MTTIVGVRFKQVGRMYYFDPAGLPLKLGDCIVVETQRGVELGECVMEAREVEDEKIVPPLRKVLRKANDDDLDVARHNKRKEQEAAGIFQKKVGEHKLLMKFVDVEYSFDGSKIIFFFTADGRVDFRELVKDLASIFRTRIELRQIGVRDEAKMLGGIGICGRPFCCSSFLEDFQPVSIKMAKEQSLSLNPTKISGTCGRLMCCLKYEQDAYEDLLAQTPRVDSAVMTPNGPGIITEVSLLRGNLKVRLDAAPDVPVKVFHKSEVSALSGGARQKNVQDMGKRESPAPSPSSQEKTAPVRLTSTAQNSSSLRASRPVQKPDHVPPAPDPVRSFRDPPVSALLFDETDDPEPAGIFPIKKHKSRPDNRPRPKNKPLSPQNNASKMGRPFDKKHRHKPKPKD